MKRFFKKLCGKNGASMVLALLIVLMSTFAGAGVITMAATNIGRYAHDTDDQQAYYSVTSAAILIRDTLANAKYTSKIAEYVYQSTWSYDPAADDKKGEHKLIEKYTLNFTEKGNFVLDNDNIFGEAIVGHMDKVFRFRSIPDEWYSNSGEEKSAINSLKDYSFTITSNNITIGTVNATLIYNDNYDLLFSFIFQSGNSKLYSVSLYMEAVVNVVTETEITSNPTGKDTGEKQTTTSYVEVNWPADKSTISRGEAIPGTQSTTPGTDAGTGE